MNDKLRQLFKDFSRYAKGGHVRLCWQIADQIEAEISKLEAPMEAPDAEEIAVDQKLEVMTHGTPVFSCMFASPVELQNWVEAIATISGERVESKFQNGRDVVMVIGDCAKVKSIIREQLVNLSCSDFRFL